MQDDRSECVKIQAYDPDWRKRFQEAAARLHALLGPDLALRLEHVGSTAIPGMPAKPVIDILVEIPSFERALAEAMPKLSAAGWAYGWRSDRPPGHMMFILGLPPNGPRTQHVHMAPRGHKLWERIAFRDYLIEHPLEAERYARLKLALANQYPHDRESYTNGKGVYVGRITALALTWREAHE